MLSIIRKPYFENYMIPAYQHIVRSHIGSERVNAEPIHLLPPPAASGLEARSTLFRGLCLGGTVNAICKLCPNR